MRITERFVNFFLCVLHVDFDNDCVVELFNVRLPIEVTSITLALKHFSETYCDILKFENEKENFMKNLETEQKTNTDRLHSLLHSTM